MVLINLTLLQSVRTTTPLEHPSTPSFDNEWDMNGDVISEAPQDHCTAQQQANPEHRLNVSTVECAFLQALKRDGYRCMLSGKVDTIYKIAFKKQIATADIAFHDASDAANKAAAAPSNFQLQQEADQLAREYNELNSTAQCAAATLAKFPNTSLCITNTAHIFPESADTDLGNDKNVRCSALVQIVFLIHIPE
jgi:hypothetical protein